MTKESHFHSFFLFLPPPLWQIPIPEVKRFLRSPGLIYYPGPTMNTPRVPDGIPSADQPQERDYLFTSHISCTLPQPINQLTNQPTNPWYFLNFSTMPGSALKPDHGKLERVMLSVRFIRKRTLYTLLKIH